ncbi:UNVERIFIED_CONTAM: hypothetical protein NCL1_38257 [Trichonephila clavipes]
MPLGGNIPTAKRKKKQQIIIFRNFSKPRHIYDLDNNYIRKTSWRMKLYHDDLQIILTMTADDVHKMMRYVSQLFVLVFASRSQCMCICVS